MLFEPNPLENNPFALFQKVRWVSKGLSVTVCGQQGDDQVYIELPRGNYPQLGISHFDLARLGPFPVSDFTAEA